MNPMPTSTMVEMLVPIWQRVLQLSSIGVDDNFFEVGGDSTLALALFNEIAQACGRELPPVMIYHAPTIAALAAVLEESAAPRVPPLVQLKAGSAEPPVFITHGLGGSVMDFFQVVKHIQTPRAIYGMQQKGIDGAEEPSQTYRRDGAIFPRGRQSSYSLTGLIFLSDTRSEGWSRWKWRGN